MRVNLVIDQTVNVDLTIENVKKSAKKRWRKR